MYFCFTSRSGKEASGAYDHLGELDQALFMYLDHGSSHGGGATQQERRRKCVSTTTLASLQHALLSDDDRNSTAAAAGRVCVLLLHSCVLFCSAGKSNATDQQ